MKRRTIKKNPVENIEVLINKHFAEEVTIVDKSVTNNCIGALVDEDNFKEFSKAFEQRLERLSKNITCPVQRKEIVNKLKNLAEETGYKWSGPYSELVALDFFLNSEYIHSPQYINTINALEYPDSLPAKNGKRTIDIDFSFEIGCKKIFTDIKSLIPTQIELIDTIIESVIKTSGRNDVLIGVDNLTPENFFDLKNTIKNEKNLIEKVLLDGIKKSKECVSFCAQSGITYCFRISYHGSLSTINIVNPYKLAEKDKFKYLNYSNKLLGWAYSLLTFVINPWFNNQINDFNGCNKIYYRSVSRRVFMEFKDDKTPAYKYFDRVKSDSGIMLADISSNIAGLLFIEDKSVKKEKDGYLYKTYLYLNPNYKNTKPLTCYNFSSYLDNPPISKMIEIDDFKFDNY